MRFIVLAVARYSLNGIYELTEVDGAQTASGYLGLVIFAASLYGGLAFGLEDVQHNTVLPLGGRGEALQAFEGDLSEQVGPSSKRPGSESSSSPSRGRSQRAPVRGLATSTVYPQYENCERLPG